MRTSNSNFEILTASFKDMRMLRLRKPLLMKGIFAGLTWIIGDLYASNRYEGYQWPIDAISGLSAFDSPMQSMSRAGTHEGGKVFRGFSYTIILAMLILGTLPLLSSLEIGVDKPPAFSVPASESTPMAAVDDRAGHRTLEKYAGITQHPGKGVCGLSRRIQ